MTIGDTFLIDHLWVVISDPAKNGGKFVIVNLTTDKIRAGEECALSPGDHPWIIKKSYVSFGDAREVGPKEEAELTKHITSGKIKRHFPMGHSVLRRITATAGRSKALPTILRCHFVTPKQNSK